MNESRPVHIVALNGSPHKGGNTATLMGWVLEGYREAGAEAEWLHIGDYDLRSCQGCLACLRTGDCVLEDDYRLLRGKLLAADGIVIGASSYEGQPPARLKVFLERLMLLNLYTLMFSRQYVMGVATSGLSWCDDLAESLTTGLGWHSGTISARTSTLAHGYRPLAEAHPKRLLAQARALGRRLVANIRTPKLGAPPAAGLPRVPAHAPLPAQAHGHAEPRTVRRGAARLARARADVIDAALRHLQHQMVHGNKRVIAARGPHRLDQELAH